ncbi:MAG: energy transducer TonB, partial [Nitrospira sp.]|nr:energy transducer TonB [Nitrospira sp.]
MTSKDDSQFCAPAWGVSLVLHGVVVGLAFAFVAQVKPVLQTDTFQWDVALVEEASSNSKSEPTESVVASAHPPVKKSFSSQTKPVLERSQPVMPVEQKIEPPQTTIEQEVEAPQIREKLVEQRIAEVEEPAVEMKEPEPVMADPSPNSVEAEFVEHESVVVASAPGVPVFQEVPISAESYGSRMDADPVRVGETQASVPEAKVDNRWLAESLWRRVAELKRYPNSARMNGQEGKVILKAVIRSDGQLADVFVQ